MENVEKEKAFYFIIDSGIILSQKLCEAVIQSLAGVLTLYCHQPIAKLKNLAYLGCILATKPVKVVTKFGALSDASAKAIDALRVRTNTVDVEIDEVEDVQEALLVAIQFVIDDFNRFGKPQSRQVAQIIFVSNRAGAFENTSVRRNLQTRVTQWGLSRHNLIVLHLTTERNGACFAQCHEASTSSSTAPFSFTQQIDTDCGSNELLYVRLRNSTVDIECYFKQLFGEVLRMVPSSLKLVLSDVEILCDCQLVALNAFQGVYELETPFTHRSPCVTEVSAQIANTLCGSIPNEESYQLRVVSQIPLAQLSETVLIGRPVLIQPTQLWRFEVDELIRNQLLFQTLCEKLQASSVALICEMKKPVYMTDKFVTLCFAVFAIQLSDFDQSCNQRSFQQAPIGASAKVGHLTMLIRQLLPRELYACPRNRIFLNAPCTEDEQFAMCKRFDSLLRTIPRIESFNPLLFGSGLFDSANANNGPRLANATTSKMRPGQQQAPSYKPVYKS